MRAPTTLSAADDEEARQGEQEKNGADDNADHGVEGERTGVWWGVVYRA